MSIVTTNFDIPFIHHERVVEWDIKSANTSLMQYYGLATDKVISKLRDLPKDKRTVMVGKMMGRDKVFAKALEKAFTDAITMFIEVNAINNSNIVSIKKDAIFIRNVAPKISDFGNGLEFVDKNAYAHVILAKPYEFYVSRTDIDVKGIADTKVDLHKDGVLDFVRNVCNTSHDYAAMHEYIKEYITEYKARNLPFDAYREFTTDSKFTVDMYGTRVSLDQIDEPSFEMCDITFNYKNVILPILSAVMG